MFQHTEATGPVLSRRRHQRDSSEWALTATRLVPGASLKSVAEARAWVGELCSQQRLSSGLRQDVLLVTSELVTNAIVHTGSSSIALRFDRTGRTVRVCVTDQGPVGPLSLRTPTADDITGRGLIILDGVADRWGTECIGGGTRVWAELTSSDDGSQVEPDTSVSVHQHAYLGERAPDHFGGPIDA